MAALAQTAPPAPALPFPAWSDALAPLAAEAWVLEAPAPHERRAVLRDEAAFLVDRLLTRVARGRGALDIALGEGLCALSEGGRVLKLGPSSLGDYARERLGIAESTADKMARLAARLRERPLLREAVWRGEVSMRKAETIVQVARGDAEAAWVARARTETVRALAAAVARERSGSASTGDGDEDGPWERIVIEAGPGARATFDEALSLAGRLLGAAAPTWQRVEALCQEYLSAHPQPEPPYASRIGSAPGFGSVSSAPIPGWRTEAMAALEAETRRWEFLDAVPPVPAPAGGAHDEPGAATDGGGRDEMLRLDAHLRGLAAMRDRWDELVGHLAMLARGLGLWRDMQFVDFAHYCTERLGMAPRTVEQRITLERQLHDLPALRAAVREGRLSYEQARLIAHHAFAEGSITGPAPVDDLIAKAERLTCIALRTELESTRGAQMCARGAVEVRVPSRVSALLFAALAAARVAAGGHASAAECLERIARHFIDTWKPALPRPRTPEGRARARDGGRCQVPGCSRAATHAHHVLFRSRGGSDALSNLVATCAPHHLRGIHEGHIGVTGVAPHALRWTLPVRPGVAPLADFAGGTLANG